MKIKQILKDVEQFQLASDQPVSNTPLIGNYNDFVLRNSLMLEESWEYLEACNDEDIVEVLDACVDMLYILAGTINQHGLQDKIEEAFNRVHANNMTKVVDGKVIRNKEGKILKPEGFVPVDLSDLLKENRIVNIYRNK